MDLRVTRFSTGAHDTLGILQDVTGGEKFLCFTLEDTYHEMKIPGETRIPAGSYEIKLRTEGHLHEVYSTQFPGMHQGMLWLQDVPDFQYVLIHIGNTDGDTEGCLLVGDGATQNASQKGTLTNSTAAYKRVYPYILDALQRGEKVEITYVDFDR